jgi:hypothetical protein
VDTSKLPIVLLALGLGVGASGCAKAGPTLPDAKRIAEVTVVSAHAVISAVQDTEMRLVCGRAGAPSPPACVPIETHREISSQLVRAFDLELAVARVVKAVPSSGLSPDLAKMLSEVSAIVRAVLDLIPPSSQRSSLIVQLGGA